MKSTSCCMVAPRASASSSEFWYLEDLVRTRNQLSATRYLVRVDMPSTNRTSVQRDEQRCAKLATKGGA